MALRRVPSHIRCVRAFLPSLRSAVERFQTYSSCDDEKNAAPFYHEDTNGVLAAVAWPDITLGPLNRTVPEFPLPGNVGLEPQLSPAWPTATQDVLQDAASKSEDVVASLIMSNQPAERHFQTMNRYFTLDAQKMEEFLPETPTPSASDTLECAAYDCPQLLRKDCADLFPDRNTMEGPFTVITLSQHTDNDMSMWSMEVENERDSLFEIFMQGAMEMCKSLSENGFWADFIDPMSGKPFKGPHTNATMFETDERYCKLGFTIDDLGCCKVIRHPVWGTHAFVSCLFTNAPVDHPIISHLIKPA